VKVTGQQFGIATQSFMSSLGILGVAPITATSGPNAEPLYDRFIDSLAKQGLTKSRTFSLDLRDVSSPDGTSM
jgi:Eukaryotic aspartyl protease